ncbi:cytochrome d ubiquinol oxidase subunit II [Adhaeretor mobilis]|uniref:Cytochrome bd-I ubiquinol oxidase subunit 2 n=1 Tax=Adhaeretor mobilis TaxID=1930276 RepID=A0A517MRD4_9BACT|nr:cytochrome d ubiquinol oxidase subunit II [Adhaeretor mobilis]QDS97435.1 Cytochrome bd-I ubiquinol oxidase subunit 2 [Adhaeretor mobilis]
MGPDDLLLLVMLVALTLYALLGGADFGAGVWEFTTALQSTDKQRQHIYKAIGPVWEANHVWLIFVLVILMNGFPVAFAALSRALWLPLLLALCGIVFRGAGYAFRSYSRGTGRELAMWESVFAIASTATPLFLGASVGAVASGQLAIAADGQYEASHLTGWMSSFAVFTGFYAVGMCAYLAAVYLAREAAVAKEDDLTQLWRQRSLSTGLWMGLLSIGGLAMVSIEAPTLAAGFAHRGWPLVVVSLACGIGSLIEVWRNNFLRAVIASSGAVAAVLWGWAVSQYPLIVPPTITSGVSKAPDNILWTMLVVITVGAVFLLPSLSYLFVLFKSNRQRPY